MAPTRLAAGMLAASFALTLQAVEPAGAASRAVVVPLVPPAAGAAVAAKPAPMPRIAQTARRGRVGLARSTAVGWQSLPFTMARVEVAPVNPAGTSYRPIGKVKSDLGHCTGTLIRPGIVLTAAHCLVEYGKGAAAMSKSVTFSPGYSTGQSPTEPFGSYTGAAIIVPSVWVNGTDMCRKDLALQPFPKGALCNNDLALVVLAKKNGYRAGDYAGWIKTVTTPSPVAPSVWLADGNSVAQVTVVGYPGGFENGGLQIRTDAVAQIDKFNGTVFLTFGTLMGHGASGAALIANFGKRPTVTDANYTNGSLTDTVVVGVYASSNSAPNAFSSGQAYGTVLGMNGQFPQIPTISDLVTYGPGNIGYLLKQVCTNPIYKVSHNPC